MVLVWLGLDGDVCVRACVVCEDGSRSQRRREANARDLPSSVGAEVHTVYRDLVTILTATPRSFTPAPPSMKNIH